MGNELAVKGLQILLRQHDDGHRLHQKLESPLLSIKAAKTYVPLMQLESKQLLQDLLTGSGDTGVDPHPAFEVMTSSIVYSLIYGMRIRRVDDPDLDAIRTTNHDFQAMLQVGRYLIDLFPSLDPFIPRFMAPWRDDAERYWTRKRDLNVANLEKAYRVPGWNMSKYMKETLAKGSIEMPIEEIAFDVGSLGDAAVDTSSKTLQWFAVACTTADRGFVAKAQSELDSVIGKKRLPTYEDKSKLVYIDAIVEELLRWGPAVPDGVPHFTRVESTYNGHRIPANSVIIPNQWSMAREEAIYGPNADDFDPERWLIQDENGNYTGLKDLPQVGFGFGRRACTGRNVARTSLWIAVARVLWAFDMRATPDDQGNPIHMGPKDYADIMAGNPLPFKVQFKPRGNWVRDVVMDGIASYQDTVELLDRIGSEVSSR